MNRNNKILVGVLAFIVAMTIGYALFSDTIIITGTAKAKGDFSLKVTCTPGISPEIDTLADDFKGFNWLVGDGSYTDSANLISAYPENNYSNDTCIVEGNNVKFHADLSQPGARRYFTVKIVNEGSIPINMPDFNFDSGSTITGTITNQENYLKKIENSELAHDSIQQLAGLVGSGFSIKYPDQLESGFVTGDTMYFIYVINCPEKLIDVYRRGDYFLDMKELDLKIDYENTITYEQVR